MSLLAKCQEYLQTFYSSDQAKDADGFHPVSSSKFRLDTDSSSILHLPDGRELGYAQYGDLTGRPIFYCHGFPGSRLEGALFDDLGLRLRARIIATDRPGMGWSSAHPERTLLDFPKDLQHLAQHLGLQSFGVLGVSGGGPYALACARAMSRDQLKCVSIVCGLGPPDIGMKGAGFVHWLGFTVGFRYGPRFLNRWFFQMQPEGRMDLSDGERFQLLMQQVHKSRALGWEKDLDILEDGSWAQMIVRSNREAYTQGFDGMLKDGETIASDFGFIIEDIDHELPVQLWYGRQDTFVPLNHGVQIAARLGSKNTTLRVEEETHLSIFANHQEEILQSMLEKI